MIQRIQSLYLLGAIIILSIVSFYGSFFTLVTDVAIYDFTASGITAYTHDKANVIKTDSLPLYGVSIALIVLVIVVMFSFKKLNKQAKLARLLWGFYFLCVVAIVLWSSFFAQNQVEGEVLKSHYGAAFYILVIGIAFVHLAFMGIRKDKATIDSLNRLR